jgi:hypothetical protein
LLFCEQGVLVLLREHHRRLTESLQVRHGWMFATEREQRIMIAEKRQGRLPGARSLYRVRKQREARGEVEVKHVWPGARMPDGQIANRRHVFVRNISRQEARAKARKKRKRALKAGPPFDMTAWMKTKQEERSRIVVDVGASRTVRRQASVPLLAELLEPRKLAALIDPPAPVPKEQLSLPDRRRAEIDRQLAELARHPELVDEDDKPPD